MPCDFGGVYVRGTQPIDPKYIYTNMDRHTTLTEEPDVKATQSGTYKEINVTGQVSHLDYDGLKLTVLHDSPDLTNTLHGSQIKVSKIIINRQIECTLNLSPMSLKAWALILGAELVKYEKMFGTVLSPEEIEQKYREHS